MRQFLLTLLLVTGIAIAADAQVYLPGKLVLAAGDTLEGLVSIQGGITYGFRKDKNAPERIFQRKEIIGYMQRDATFEEYEFEVLRGKFPERIKDFLEVINEGQVRLLRYEGTGIFGNERTCFYLHERDMLQPLRVNMDDGNFRVQMRQYFSDYPELVERIKSKELGYDKIQEIVQIYNSWYEKQDHSNESQPAPRPTVEGKKPKKEKPAKVEKEEKEDADPEE